MSENRALDIETLGKLEAVVGEHVNNYLLVVEIDGATYIRYNDPNAALGMAHLVRTDMEYNWNVARREHEDHNGS